MLIISTAPLQNSKWYLILNKGYCNNVKTSHFDVLEININEAIQDNLHGFTKSGKLCQINLLAFCDGVVQNGDLKTQGAEGFWHCRMECESIKAPQLKEAVEPHSKICPAQLNECYEPI